MDEKCWIAWAVGLTALGNNGKSRVEQISDGHIRQAAVVDHHPMRHTR
jgi:hypothetical protein